jgi:uncharacterized membrane protein YgcG
MKTLKFSFIACLMNIAATVSAGNSSNIATDSTGLPGDHFSLQGALDLFEKSANPEEFEKKLNDENNYVNNLDLNGDNEIDYIKVIDHKDGDAHALVLQVAVSETESQDVAVIEIEKNGESSAVIQIVGDEELYGAKTIAEPFDEKDIQDSKTSGRGPSAPEFFSRRIIVNVWFWPGIQFIYAPAYILWASPWHWHYYPVWWKPWNPHPWRWHYAHCSPYMMHCRMTDAHRVMVAHSLYVPLRRNSVMVSTRYKGVREMHQMNTAQPMRKENPGNMKNSNRAPGRNPQKMQRNGNMNGGRKGGGAPHGNGGGGHGGRGGRGRK